MPFDGIFEDLGLFSATTSIAWAPEDGHAQMSCPADPAGLSGPGSGARLRLRPELPALLEKALRQPGGHVARPLMLGADTDPYQPVERTLALTRAVLEVLERFGHPVTIVTRSTGVLRDLDILQRMARRGLVHVSVALATLDPTLARRMEPRSAAPAQRLAVIGALAAAGIPTVVLAAPMIPGLNDAELERILAAGAAAGATGAGHAALRLPPELAGLFEGWVRTHLPGRAAQVLALVRQNRAAAGLAGARPAAGAGGFEAVLAARFGAAAGRLGLNRAGTWRTDDRRFAAPGQAPRPLTREPQPALL